ncbi:MAG: VCBS repeat-containing protein [Pirellulales bacterium]
MNSSSSSRDGSASRRNPPPKQIVLLLAVIAVTVGLFVVHRLFRPPAGPSGPAGQSGQAGGGPPTLPALSAADTRELLRMKSQAIGLMENVKVAEADQLWGEMAQKLPDEPLVAVNRALGKLLALESEKADRSDAAFASALEAAVHAQKVAPKSWVPYWVEGRIQNLERNRQSDFDKRNERIAAAVKAFEKSAEIGADQVVPRFQLFDAAKESTDPAVIEAGRKAIIDAHRIAPTNMTVFISYLEIAVESKSPELRKEVEAFRKLVRPIAAGLQRRSRRDINATLDALLAHVEKEEWPQAMGQVRMIGNIVRPDDVQRADFRRTLPNALELLVYDFSSVQLAELAPEEAPPVEVKFVPRELAGLAVNASGEKLGGPIHDLKVVDFDLDGQLDIVVLQGERLRVYGRVVSEAAPAANRTWQADPAQWKVLLETEVGAGYQRVLIADFDTDNKLTGTSKTPTPAAPATPPATAAGSQPEVAPTDDLPAAFYIADADFVLYGPAGVKVLRNEREGEAAQRKLEVVAQDGGLELVKDAVAATLADFDHDGDLDLALVADGGITLWTNRGNITFDNVTSGSTLPPTEPRPAQLIAVDWDRDIDADLLVADASGKLLGYLENLRHIEFQWRELPPEFAALRGATELAVVECDGNASWDLLVASETGVRLQLTTTPAPGSVRPLKGHEVSKTPMRHVFPWDYDNDSFPDAIAWGATAEIYRGRPDGTLQKTSELLPAFPADATACEPVDLDGDGDLDLVAASADRISVWINEGGNGNRWLDVLVRGLDEDISGRVNHFGLGGWIEVRSDARYQAQLVTRPYSHFGLGPAEKVDVVRVMFTNGVPQSVLAPPPGVVVREAQALKGSCPYLYVWNGEKYEFYTDLLWNAPLGLQIADGVLLRDRPWEYLKVDGDKLVAQDGVYRIQITEELWEAGYFDQVELIAVDHPADVEVFTNEKVGPAEIAERKLHPVRQRRRPIVATDAYGRDLLPLLAQRDDQFAQCYQRTYRQGLAEPHFLELHLGPLENPQNVTLFLTGWILPTDTSLNIGLSQNRELDGPRPPYILVPDGQGGWREALGFMGFPGGKTKTIAVDVTSLLVPGDARLRIATTNEIRWDEAFFSVDEAPAEMRQTPLKLRSADLHYRGVSRPLPRSSPAIPWKYDHQQVEVEPVWPPMAGKFTRYGDVRELLGEWDDRMVVLGAGDEMTLEFDAGPPPPAGWKRDFLLHNVGWDKDADIHTVYGQSVEPLPFKAMPSYPYPESEYPQNAQTLEYLRTYQTREQPPERFWRQLQHRQAPPR